MAATVCMLVFPEAQALDVVGPLELFRSASVNVEIAAAASEQCFMSSGIAITPTVGLDGCHSYDVLFIPGGSGISCLLADDRYRSFVARISATAAYVTSVCTGSLLLGTAGVLRGYRAASHWRYAELLRLCGAQPVDERVVIDRNRITAGGVTAGIDFGLKLVALLKGDDIASYVQLALEYNPDAPTGGHPSKTRTDVVERYRKDSAEWYAIREAEIRAALERPVRT